MNLFNFLQAGGFPMDVNVLDQMQTAYKLHNSLGALAGDIAIIKGCIQTGSNISDGVVYINGEVLEFRAGVVASNVIIIQEPESKEFENGDVKEVHYTRYATFGVATTSYPWVSFKRAFPTTEIVSALALKEDKTTVTALLARITALEAKMATIATGAEVNVQSDFDVTLNTSDAYIKNKPVITNAILYKGVYAVGNPSGDQRYTISFPSVGTSNYFVLGSFRSISGDSFNNNDLVWCFGATTHNSFELSVVELGGITQNVYFYYVLIPL